MNKELSLLCIEPKGGIDRNFMEAEVSVYIGAGRFEHNAKTLVQYYYYSYS